MLIPSIARIHIWRPIALAAVMLGLSCAIATAAKPPTPGNDPNPGAIYTTDAQGVSVNQNTFYETKADVYLNGGPKHNAGAAGLEDGFYYVQVTAPSGSPVLGKTPGADVHVTQGAFDEIYHLVEILKTASSGFTEAGYDDTTNGGGVYKVWVSKSANFDSNLSKTDNFKVKQAPPVVVEEGEGKATLHIIKFYDTNADGEQDPGEPNIPGWLFHVSDNISLDRYTTVENGNPAEIKLLLAAATQSNGGTTYAVHEANPNELYWVHTTATFGEINLFKNDDKTVFFGNACIGQRGGLTLGFWSNKNGQKNTTANDLTYLAGLSLRNADGSNFDPTSTAALSKWILSANASNMANMLSAQLTAMTLNVRHANVSGVDGTYVLYRPELIPFGITYNSGFITLNSLITAANASLATDGKTVASGAVRSYQELIKNALDDANNNKPFYVLPPDSTLQFSFP